MSGALVVGAETAVGAALAARLHRVDGRAAALCATAASAAPLRARGVEVFVGDAADPEVVTVALVGRAELYVVLSDPPPPPPPPPPSPRPIWSWRGAQGPLRALLGALSAEVGLTRRRGDPIPPTARPTPPPSAPRPTLVLEAALTASARLRALNAPLRCTLICGDLALAPSPEGDPRPLEPTSPLCAQGRGAALAAALQRAERALWTTVIHGVTYLAPEDLSRPLTAAPRGLRSCVQLDDLVTGLLLLRAHDRALDPTGGSGSGRWLLGGDQLTLGGRARSGRAQGRGGGADLDEGADRPLSSRRARERLGYSWRPHPLAARDAQ